MKTLIASLLFVSATAMANVDMPSFGNADFAATARYAKKVAFDRADAFAADRGEEVV